MSLKHRAGEIVSDAIFQTEKSKFNIEQNTVPHNLCAVIYKDGRQLMSVWPATQLTSSRVKRHYGEGKKRSVWEPNKKETQAETEDKERERWGGRIGLKFSDNETSPVIVPAVINGVPSYSGSPCPWEEKRWGQGRREAIPRWTGDAVLNPAPAAGAQLKVTVHVCIMSHILLHSCAFCVRFVKTYSTSKHFLPKRSRRHRVCECGSALRDEDDRIKTHHDTAVIFPRQHAHSARCPTDIFCSHAREEKKSYYVVFLQEMIVSNTFKE